MTTLTAPILEATDFNQFLHLLRTRELQRLPADARTVVSGGCAGEWYFGWFADNFPGAVERHYGVELFAPAPQGLSGEVVWLQQSLGSMDGVAEGEADLVFCGEVIEHLWPDDIAGLLLEAWRVLRPGGVFALDSPNRVIAQALQWTHPEHTLELSVAEIVELLDLAGFDEVSVRGVWQCYDAARHRVLRFDDLDGESIERSARVIDAGERPEDAFVWWATARRAERPPDAAAVQGRLHQLFRGYRAERLARPLTQASLRHADAARGTVVESAGREAEVLVHGPYVPMPPGRWEAVYTLALAHPPAPDTHVADLDVVAMSSEEPLARRAVFARDLPADGGWVEIAVPFDAERTHMGVEFRAIAANGARLKAVLQVDAGAPRPGPSVGEPERLQVQPGDASVRRRLRVLARRLRERLTARGVVE